MVLHEYTFNNLQWPLLDSVQSRLASNSVPPCSLAYAGEHMHDAKMQWPSSLLNELYSLSQSAITNAAKQFTLTRLLSVCRSSIISATDFIRCTKSGWSYVSVSATSAASHCRKGGMGLWDQTITQKWVFWLWHFWNIQLLISQVNHFFSSITSNVDYRVGWSCTETGNKPACKFWTPSCFRLSISLYLGQTEM